MGLFSKKKTGSTEANPTKETKVSLFERYRNGRPGEMCKQGSAANSISTKTMERDDNKLEDERRSAKQSAQSSRGLEDTLAPLGEGFGLASAPPPSKGLGRSKVPGGTGLIGYLSR
ncbi:hypothetical protein LIA77_11575 [Sarocladium implicatum]|jgi:hypothetical protein|nr:hypothetical protein LIA77_11575 [Sarocladium implicatum]